MAGSGITTTLIAIIANAGQEDQAVATAGRHHATLFLVDHLNGSFSFLPFPVLGICRWLVRGKHTCSGYTTLFAAFEIIRRQCTRGE